ncbi:MAG TPA: ParB/RepB/Spo0J family partition protein [Bryobacteraceae bacterium]|nr:ParB/RepB/Spo0J family partition protein [Bryobacteraceae bacterium]
MNKIGDTRKALGKGLSALLPARPVAQPVPDAPPHVEQQPNPATQGLLDIPIEQIDPNPVQPRVSFKPERLEELAQSIRARGIIQPLIVQRAGDRYQLVAGERRWRAAKLAGLEAVPVVVREFVADRLLEVALIENIQREDLNAIEVAEALDRLVREHSLNHDEIGRRTGKDRSTVSNLIRLLKLPRDIQALVADHRLSMGHARAILALPTEEMQKEIAERAAAQGLSVRQVERLIQMMTARREPGRQQAPALESERKDPNVDAAARELEAALGTRVRIVSQSSDRGKIEIEFFSADDLDRIYSQIVASR